MVAGRLNDLNEIDNFEIEVFAQGFENNFELKGQANTQKREIIFPDEEYSFVDFTERHLTIQELLDKKGKGTPEEKGNATDEALCLSLKYNFVTPLTSMVFTKPEDDTKKGMFIADKLTEGMNKLSNSKQKFARTHGYGALKNQTKKKPSQ
ncbi:inter-alpha-trypsin inhibitor heavy chain H3-like, partial [Sinocyclocheilus rhinocerous]|uniref:inter-alpha-trypsin inhibitor heavy chain H3-like n=1 Tax=Sinocyclocheilus rhinocerous TaxID=307959 RepID=UPI0007B80A32